MLSAPCTESTCAGVCIVAHVNGEPTAVCECGIGYTTDEDGGCRSGIISGVQEQHLVS